MTTLQGGSRDEACRLYLYGELAKFDDLEWAEKLVRERQEQERSRAGLGGSGLEVNARFRDQQLVDGFVDALDGDAAYAIAVYLSSWRGNSVRDRVSEPRVWRLEHVPIEAVDLNETEAELKPLWSEHRRWLVRIVEDPRLWQADPYAGWSHGRCVAHPELLAVPQGGRVFVFDGVHRAIQMAWDGAAELSLLVGRPSG